MLRRRVMMAQKGGSVEPILLFHFNDVNNVAKEEVGTNLPSVTVRGSINTNYSKFGGGSLTGRDAIDIQRAYDQYSITIGEGEDYTIDFWYRKNSQYYGGMQVDIEVQNGPNSRSSLVRIGTDTNYSVWLPCPQLYVRAHVNDEYIDSGKLTPNIDDYNFHHFAFVRHGTSHLLFFDGELKFSCELESVEIPVVQMIIGGNNDYIDEFRMCRGAAWTNNFTPPSAPYEI